MKNILNNKEIIETIKPPPQTTTIKITNHFRKMIKCNKKSPAKILKKTENLPKLMMQIHKNLIATFNTI
jgi:hypothetical protein